jgi:hypothetical protein
MSRSTGLVVAAILLALAGPATALAHDGDDDVFAPRSNP